MPSPTAERLSIGAILVLVIGCGSKGPTIDPLEDQVASVGSQFTLEVQAASRSGGSVAFAYDTDAKVGDRADLKQRPGGSAVFSWTPTAEDIGQWTFDFHARDGSGRATESIAIDVKSAIGEESAPQFLRPLGAGATLDLDQAECIELEIEVADQDSVDIAIAQDEAPIKGAEMLDNGDGSGLWRWCPTPDQAAAKSRYQLTLSADDSENPKALKRYQIILRRGDGESCGGEQPEILHQPRDFVAIEDIVIQATIKDVGGIKAPPVVYWSTTEPMEPPELATMTMVPMAQISGDTQEAEWEATIPNIAVADPDEATRKLYYLIIADDNDDNGGPCDHVTRTVYQAQITDPGGEGGLPPCAPCSSSHQCGTADDVCLNADAAGASRCFQACDNGNPCPSGTVCTGNTVTSVEGVEAKVCIPMDGACPQESSCDDDPFAGNTSAESALPLTEFTDTSDTGSTISPELALCPAETVGVDEDWFTITVEEEGTLGIALQAAGAVDSTPQVDMNLYDADGNILAKREDWGSDDRIWYCAQPGEYRIQVHSYYRQRHAYKLSYFHAPESCEVSSCEDDLFESDDTFEDGRFVSLFGAYRSTENMICQGDEDYFVTVLGAGETLYATIKFDHTTATEDLDLLLYNEDELEWVNECIEEHASQCDPDNGQSSTSNEALQYTAPTGGGDFGIYSVVVRGFAGSSNGYDVCISVKEDECQ